MRHEYWATHYRRESISKQRDIWELEEEISDLCKYIELIEHENSMLKQKAERSSNKTNDRWSLGGKTLKYGEYLRLFRLAAGKSQTEIAIFLGCKQAYVSAVESGKRLPLNSEKTKKLSEFLNLDRKQIKLLQSARRKNRS